MTLEEILSLGDGNAIVEALSYLKYPIPQWSGDNGLEREYNPALHSVMDKQKYPDIPTPEGMTKVTRVAIPLQKLATKRMTELCVAIPVKRIYKTTNDKQKEIATLIEKIFKSVRVDSLNIERMNRYFASCQLMSLWYAVPETHSRYGVESNIKLKVKSFSPMDRVEIYPFFDDFDDLKAISIASSFKTPEGKEIKNFDIYTQNQHILLKAEGAKAYEEVLKEDIQIPKIPAVYMQRDRPIWEHSSSIVEEIEWALSRNGNYLRKNSKPIFAIFSDDFVNVGESSSDEKKSTLSVLQYPRDARAEYITWEGSTDNLQFYIKELKSLFFSSLQLPDWSYENMRSQALSGESRKQLFIDAHLKTHDEKGALLEFFHREINIIKEYAKVILGESYSTDIDALEVECEITPFSITDDGDSIKNLSMANGGKPLISHRESIEYLGWSSNADATLEEIQKEDMNDAFAS